MKNNSEINRLSGVGSILHINEKGGKFGGTEEYIISLAQLLSPMGISSHLLYEHLHGDLPSCLQSLRKIAGLSNRHGDEEVGERVLRAVSELNPDVVYVHNIFDGRIIEALDQPEREYLIIWYVHDHFPTCLTELRALNRESETICYQALSQACLDNVEAGLCIKRYVEKTFVESDLLFRQELLQTLPKADAVVVVSHFMKEILVKNLPALEDKIYFLPRQVRASQETNRGQKQQSRTSRTIVYSGRITREKGLHWAIEALEYLKVDQEVLFKIAGVVENKSYWLHCLELAKKVEAQNPAIKISYLGHLSYQGIDAVYADADIVVVPSIWGEPSGTVAAEAMHNGAAVVASDVGGINIWLIPGKTGLLVKPNDAIALSEALKQLISDDELRDRLANAGRKLINSQFTAQEHLKALSKVIEQCSPRQRGTE